MSAPVHIKRSRCKVAVQGTVLTFQAKTTNTTPSGIFRIYLSNPSSDSPGVAFKHSSLTLSIYSPLAAAVVISLAVYAIGLPICCVSSCARSYWREVRISRARRTIFWRSGRGVLLHVLKAVWAFLGRSVSSASVGVWRVRIGLLVEGEIVVRVSVDIFAN